MNSNRDINVLAVRENVPWCADVPLGGDCTPRCIFLRVFGADYTLSVDIDFV